MDFDEFRKAIHDLGGTDEDVFRLNSEGFVSARDAHDFMEYKFDSLAEFVSYCCHIGRQFVIDNLGELFHLSNEQESCSV